jgi:anti-sigma regulatory factor (Ser/Thr protein kinase)
MTPALTVRLTPGPDAAAAARRALLHLEPDMNPQLLGEVKLLVTELVTNSVRHAGLDTSGDLQLGVSLDGGRLRVEVADDGRGFRERERPEPREDRLGGWGLYLVDRISDRWGVERDGRTRVWLEMDRAAAGTEAA